MIRECLETSLDVVVSDEGFQTALRERIEAQHALLTYNYKQANISEEGAGSP